MTKNENNSKDFNIMSAHIKGINSEKLKNIPGGDNSAKELSYSGNQVWNYSTRS
jgi:hypothetical protein